MDQLNTDTLRFINDLHASNQHLSAIVDRQERFLANLKRIGIFILMLFGFWWLLSKSLPANIRAQSINVLDGDGNSRIYLGPTQEGSAAVILKDKDGNEALSVASANDFTGITVFDAHNKLPPGKRFPSITLGLQEGTSNLLFRDASSKRKIELYNNANGSCGVQFSDTSGIVHLQFDIKDDNTVNCWIFKDGKLLELPKDSPPEVPGK